MDEILARDRSRYPSVFCAVEADLAISFETCKVSTMDSAYPEWRLVGPTGATEQFLRMVDVKSSANFDGPTTI